MTTASEEVELVKRLRAWGYAYGMGSDPIYAADTIERLMKERDEAMDEVDVARLILAQNPRAIAAEKAYNDAFEAHTDTVLKLEAAEAQVAEWVKSENLWKQARDDIAKRCNEAEAQVAVLRFALETLTTQTNITTERRIEIARSAIAKMEEGR